MSPHHAKWTVSRVLFRRAVAPSPVRIIHLGDALPRRSSALTRTLATRDCSRTLRAGHPDSVSLFELAPGRACLAAGRPAVARGLLPHDFTLTCASWTSQQAIGGVISVALSLGLPRVGVTDFLTLWSPDFPPTDGSCPPAIPCPPPAARSVGGGLLPGNSGPAAVRVVRGRAGPLGTSESIY